MQLNEQKLNDFLGKAVVDIGATLHAGLVVIGEKLGLYKALAQDGPLMPGERLVTLALEAGDLDTAQRHLDRLAPVAAKMTGGSEDVRTEALAALTRFARGEEVDIRTPIEQLRVVDSKSDLAWALTFIASIELQRGQINEAQRDAEEALAAAELVGRPSLAALARTIIASLSPSGRTEQIIAPSLKAETFTNLSEYAKRRVREFTKEAPRGKHGRRTNV